MNQVEKSAPGQRGSDRAQRNESEVSMSDKGTVGAIHLIQLEACRHCDVSMTALLGTSRRKSTSTARQAVYLAARRLPIEPSYPDIGDACSRDHSTVVYGVRRAKARELADPWFAWLVHDLEAAAGRPFKRLRVVA